MDKVPEKFRRGFRPKDAFDDQFRLLSQADVILDVGANAGQTSARYRKMYPKAHIHAFEPFPRAFAGLTARFRNDPRVSCHRMALAASTGPQTLFTNSMNVTNALSPLDSGAGIHLPFGIVPIQPLAIKAMAIDDFAHRTDIHRIDYPENGCTGIGVAHLEGG